jgi:hypothetical protein
MLYREIIEDAVPYRALSPMDKRRLALWGLHSSRYMKQSDSFTDTLNKLPAYKGVIYRGMRLSPHTVARFRPGKTFTLRTNASATKWPDLAKMYAEKGSPDGKLPVVWKIRQRSAANFSAKYWHLEGHEAVLKRSTCYLVTDVSEQGGIEICKAKTCSGSKSLSDDPTVVCNSLQIRYISRITNGGNCPVKIDKAMVVP